MGEGGVPEVSVMPSCKGENELCCEVQGQAVHRVQVVCDPRWTNGLSHETKISFLTTGKLIVLVVIFPST